MAVPTMGGTQLWADRRWRAGWRIQQHVMTGHHRLLDSADRRHSYGSLPECLRALDERVLPEPAEEVVVVLHGLGRSRRSMRGMGDALRAGGHTVAELDYPSTRRPLEAHIGQIHEVVQHLEGTQRVSFVTHSLGGIVARGVLGRGLTGIEARRLVMCAPPSRGAALARALHGRLGSVFGAIMGPVGAELANGLDVPIPTIPFIIIAAGRGPKGINPIIDGDDDGIVGVEETKLQGMAEHHVVSTIHTLVMNHPQARATTLRFLA